MIFNDRKITATFKSVEAISLLRFVFPQQPLSPFTFDINDLYDLGRLFMVKDSNFLMFVSW